MANDASPAQFKETAVESTPVWMSAASYWQPPLYTVTAWLEHAPFGYWLVDTLRPRTIVELGTHYGFSYFVFCEAVKRLGLGTRTFALDSWEGDDHAGMYGEEVYDFVSAINSAHYPTFSTLMRGYFDSSLENFADGTIDLLHIDGRHGYDDAQHDFASWLPKLSSRGVVIFHDVCEHQEGFGVWRLWDEIRQQYPSYTFTHAHGLGVLGVGPDQTPELQRFFEVASTDDAEVRRTYEELGRALVDISRLDAVHEENAALRSELDRVRDELERAIEDRDEIASRAAHQLAEFSTSTSWKLTAPVRRIGDVIHKRR
jgi:hypothetical protein